MRAAVWHGIGDVRVDDVAMPRIEAPTDALVRLTSSALCGTDLHFIRGTMAPMRPGTILGHEGIGVVEAVGDGVRNFAPGDRVVIPSTIGCGHCSYCRAGYFAQCDVANPNGPTAGTAFFGGPVSTGPFNGLQAEYARIPFASVGLVALPEDLSDEQAILLSDILPTAWFGAKLAQITPGDTVAVFGCGPVGQLAIAVALHMRAARVIAVDGVWSRLNMARQQHAEAVDFNSEDPVQAIRELTSGIGVDRVIDAVGVEAQHPAGGGDRADQDAGDVQEVAPDARPQGRNWIPGDAPEQAARWYVEAVAKAGSIGIIGVYPPQLDRFPIGAAMNKNLTIQMGNCNHRKYIPQLIDIVRAGQINPSAILTQTVPLSNVVSAYEHFDRRDEGWVKVVLVPAA